MSDLNKLDITSEEVHYNIRISATDQRKSRRQFL